jgi:hypothetical protein
MTADELKVLVDRLANTLQTTLLLATRLEADLRQSARDATALLTSALRHRRYSDSSAGRLVATQRTSARPRRCCGDVV